MKTISYKTIVASILTCSALALPTISMAKEVPLLQEPKAGSAPAGVADLSYGVVPIFSSKDGSWVKIGNPRNGDVGWVKASELTGNDSTSVIFSRSISSDSGNKSSNYQVFQFGTPSKLTPDQEKAIKKLEEQQAAARQALQKAWQDMMNSWNMPSPILMPIIVVPQQSATKVSTTPVKAPSKTE